MLGISSVNKRLQTIGGVYATPEQLRDLIIFREDSIKAYIPCFIVGTCSTNVPMRLRQLQTFSNQKKIEKKMKLKAKEQTLVSRCIFRPISMEFTNMKYSTAQR